MLSMLVNYGTLSAVLTSHIRRSSRTLIMVQESKITLLGFLVHMKVVYAPTFPVRFKGKLEAVSGYLHQLNLSFGVPRGYFF